MPGFRSNPEDHVDLMVVPSLVHGGQSFLGPKCLEVEPLHVPEHFEHRSKFEEVVLLSCQ